MACSRPNVTAYSRFSGYKFKGPRRQEIHVGDMLGVLPDGMSLYLQDIPCGQCDLCLIENRYSKALRIILESQYYPDSTFFITLTYAPEFMDQEGLDHGHWQQFMKDFRRVFCQAKYCNIRDRGTLREGKEYSTTFNKIKQVVAGEYGDQFGRRHFHGILFGHKFLDLQDTGRVSKKGFPVFTSPSLASVWKKGIVQVERISFDLALYVASYVTDKSLDEVDEAPPGARPQYGRFGRGIGLRWIEEYWRDVLSIGQVKIFQDGRMREFPVPRYFMEKIKLFQPKEFEKWKRKAVAKMQIVKKDNVRKGDGSLRRARAKGRIHQLTKQRRMRDESYRGIPGKICG